MSNQIIITTNLKYQHPRGAIRLMCLMVLIFKIKSGYKLELLSKETMRLSGSLTDTNDGDKNSALVPK